MMDVFSILIIAFLFAFGACIGSFLLVVADRYISGENAFTGRSKCDNCKKNLSWHELIPFISFVNQRGACRSCKHKLSLQYPLYELFAGLFAVFLLSNAVIAGQGILVAVVMFIIACVLLVLIRIDLALMLLPDHFIWIASVGAIFVAIVTHHSFDDIALGLLVGVGFIYALWAGTAGRGIGFGDVKLMIPFGILFGFRGTVTLLFTAFFIGGLLAVWLLSFKKVTAKTAIPFGPFLAISAFLIMIIPDLPHRFFQLLGVE